MESAFVDDKAYWVISMAAITRLGLFGYGTRRTGSFLRATAVVLANLAKVSAVDAAVTGATLLDRTDIRVVEADAAVTGVTLVEWPT